MAVDGKWNLTVNSPMGAQPSTLTVTSDGGTLKGTMEGAQGSQEIEDGKVDGNSVSWVLNVVQMGLKIEFSGAVDGDKISGKANLGAFGEATFEGARG